MRANIGRLLPSACLFALWLLCAPGAQAQAPGQTSAVTGLDCDHACLIGHLHSYLEALTHKDKSRAAFAPHARFTENDVELPLGSEGLWASVSGVAAAGLEVADTHTGNAAWFGVVYEHQQPAYYAMRLKVEGGRITEVETLVERKGALPAPFGDPQQLVHDPAFAEVLPQEERRERERLVAVANGYFSTVEQNDGQLFTAFDPDCQRTENGISTTRGTGGAAAIAQGCESQFKLGLYRINKRVRERRFPLVDEERGVVVAMGFFDHANTFDSYRTTDGQTRRTALKWPNSLTLMEAFKVRKGLIYRVEAVFSYAPYFVHSPWVPVAGSGSVPPPSREGHKAACDRACLTHAADQYMDALVAHDPSKVLWAPRVRYTENSVPMQIGDGVWGTASARSQTPAYAADPATGNVAWYGLVEEHGQPAYYAMRLKVEDGRTAEVEVVMRRKEEGRPFGDPVDGDRHDPAFGEVLPAGERTARATLIKLADGYFSTLQKNDGTLHTSFDRECERQENGISTTDGSFATQARGCEAQFRLGVFRYAEKVRARRFFIADEEHGVVVAAGYIDHPARIETYQTTDGVTQKSPMTSPSSLGLMEMFKIRNGRIYRIEAVFTRLPYGMSAPWP
jgi:hypothetical protein